MKTLFLVFCIGILASCSKGGSDSGSPEGPIGVQSESHFIENLEGKFSKISSFYAEPNSDGEFDVVMVEITPGDKLIGYRFPGNRNAKCRFKKEMSTKMLEHASVTFRHLSACSYRTPNAVCTKPVNSEFYALDRGDQQEIYHPKKCSGNWIRVFCDDTQITQLNKYAYQLLTRQELSTCK